MIVTEGSTNVSVPFYFVDDVGGTAPGEPTSGLLFSDIETGGSASYHRQGEARVDFTLITLASAAAAHADGGFLLIDDTEMPGVYRCDIPDAAVAAGVDFVLIYLRAASAKNTITRPIKIDLTTVDLRETNGRVDVGKVSGTTQTAGDVTDLVVTADAAIDVAVADLANATDGLGALKSLIDALNDVSQADITGGAYSIDTDANGRIRIVDGTGVGELDTASGLVQLLAATQASIDATEADTNELQSDDVPGLIAALNDLSSANVISAMEDAGLILVDTTIATIASQTGFTLTAGSADNSAYKNCLAVIEDASTAAQKAVGIISAYVGSTKTVTLVSDPGIFTMAATDKIRILPMPAALLDWVNGQRLDAILDARMAEASISTTGGAVDTVTTLTNLPSITSNWLTAAGLAADAVTEIRDAITGGAYAFDTDANGRMRIVDGTGAGELDTASGLIAGIAGTKNTFDDLNDITVANVLTTQMTESYAANGVAPTLAQAMFAKHQKLMQSQYSGTSSITLKLDNSTTAFTGTLNDATNPTEDRRA